MSYVSGFADVALKDRPHVGGKGGSLGELQRAGMAVPAGFIVRTAAFESFLEGIEAEWPVRARISALDSEDLPAMTRCCAAVRSRLEQAPLPQELEREIALAHAQLCGLQGTPVAVRSSATTEDAVDASFAGLQDTYLWVQGVSQTLRRVRSCWASLYSVESVSYRRRRDLPEQGVAMAVVIQAMVDARAAGVMFTRSPMTGDRSVITIEAAWGLGSAVVGGEVTPDRWVLGKITGEITVREISDKAIRHAPAAGGGIETVPVSAASRRMPSLSDEELQTLRGIARKVERHYGCPQDIEWAVDRSSGEVLLLQSRPETVWSGRESAPVATAAASPFTHVMSIFGGRK
ncbi:MAG TPA: PEP/pyruvate-binding domain-containing protein [Steroidobacteraceae bacterium]|jgi:pyruvate,water dikinase|nr:PEP/pyruvate-binding domain-containing protein [Steroidobacteraceae bacterium]